MEDRLLLVRYAEFRRLQVQRQEANTAMMALLAGSKLAVNTLGLTAGSELRLSQIFPQVAHIERFDLKTDRAQAILDHAEEHLSVMAIPYVLALHEDYMLHCNSMLVNAGKMSRSVLRGLTAKSMHEKFAARCGRAFSSESLELFHLLRAMRNSHIHQGGLANADLQDARAALSPAAESLWLTLARAELPLFAVRDRVPLGHYQIIACLAITKFLSKEANVALQSVVPSTQWAEMAIADALADGVDLVGNPNQRFRKLKGFARRYYAAVSIPDSDLRSAALTSGLSV